VAGVAVSDDAVALCLGRMTQVEPVFGGFSNATGFSRDGGRGASSITPNLLGVDSFPNKIGTAGGSHPHGPYAAACPEAIEKQAATLIELSGTAYVQY
jgi:hypothetical protein